MKAPDLECFYDPTVELSDIIKLGNGWRRQSKVKLSLFVVSQGNATCHYYSHQPVQ